MNKIDLVDRETLVSVTGSLMDLNPDALFVEFSARRADAQFMRFIDLLAGEGTARQEGENRNSIELSQVSSYSGIYSIDSQGLLRDDMAAMILNILEEVKEKIELLNPLFIGHVKVSLSLGKDLIKGSLTSSQGQPMVELLDNSGQGNDKLKFLSAVTQLTKADLVQIIDSVIHSNLERKNVEYGSTDPVTGLINIKGTSN